MMPSRKEQRPPTLRSWIAPLAVVIGLGLLQLIDLTPLQILRLVVFDFYQKVKPRDVGGQPVIVIDIDERSLGKIGQWPWPRVVVADMVRNICAAGPLAVGLDIIFAEPDPLSPARIADILRGLDEPTRERIRSLADSDGVLAESLSACPVIIGQAGRGMVESDPLAGDIPAPPVQWRNLGREGYSVNPLAFLYGFPGLLRNLPQLEEAAAGLGILSLAPERDNVVRRTPLMVRVGQAPLPALSVEMLRLALKAPPPVLEFDARGIIGIGIGPYTAPTDRHGRLWINYAPYDRSRYVSAAGVLSGAADPSQFAGRYVLVGSSAIGLGDIKATPIDGQIPGVDIHRQIIETILTNNHLVRPAHFNVIELLITLGAGLLMILAVPRLGVRTALAFFVTVIVLLAVLSWRQFATAGLLLDTSPAALTVIVMYGFLSYRRQTETELQRKQVRDAFGQYLSPVLVEKLAGDPKHLHLGGERKNMTFLFCDVRGFTGIAERYRADPRELVALINRLLTPLSDAVLARQGTIDKYMGDCIMAFWNAPIDDLLHAEHACHAALDMLTALEKLNVERHAEDKAAGRRHLPLKVGIGINTGECIVGNMGSEKRFDYSVLGDPVNLASRLEEESKTYGAGILIGPETHAHVHNRFATLELDIVTVKGKSESVRVYALLGRRNLRENPAFGQLTAEHDRLLKAYRSKNWPEVLRQAALCSRRAALLGIQDIYDFYHHRAAGRESIKHS